MFIYHSLCYTSCKALTESEKNLISKCINTLIGKRTITIFCFQQMCTKSGGGQTSQLSWGDVELRLGNQHIKGLHHQSSCLEGRQHNENYTGSMTTEWKLYWKQDTRMEITLETRQQNGNYTGSKTTEWKSYWKQDNRMEIILEARQQNGNYSGSMTTEWKLYWKNEN